jgi:hypothetical protein
LLANVPCLLLLDSYNCSGGGPEARDPTPPGTGTHYLGGIRMPPSTRMVSAFM